MNNKHGFTLVELLVVISIIAILSTIGITVFTGGQKNARDARRKQDIDSIVKAMEVNYGQCGTAGKYCNLKSTFFSSGGFPSDPSGGSKCGGDANHACSYCFLGIGVPTDDTSASNAHNGCGGLNGTTDGLTPTSYWGAPIQQDAPGGTNYFISWRVCANLETPSNGKYYYCLSNQQQ